RCCSHHPLDPRARYIVHDGRPHPHSARNRDHRDSRSRHPGTETAMTTVNRTGTLLLVCMTFSACASMSKEEKGAAVGVGAGAVLGGIIGNQTGSTARGAIIGAAVGGVAGAIIGHQMDKQAAELKQNIPGATVTRVGEGIVVTFASGLLYDFDSDHVRAESASNLRNLAKSLEKYPNTDLLIVGHTDATGTDSYNQGLSERRAAAAANYLKSQGVSSGRLRTSGRGESEPIA